METAVSAAARPKPLVLMILDGWGHRDDPTDNAVAQANLPNWNHLLATCPNTLIHSEGKFVGLPDGQMGNSEVGHMNLGAGRVVYQTLTRIDAAIEDGSFFATPELNAACDAVLKDGGTLHVMGLLSPGGVHSDEKHIFAMLELAKSKGVRQVAVHAFLDGRDMPPRSAQPSIEKLQALCEKLGNAGIYSVSGRYYAMDRDKRWDRLRKAWDAIVEAESATHAPSALAALEMAYAHEENDEFVQPTVLAGAQPMKDGDAVVFMNFRADRARQLAAAFIDPKFDGFDARKPKLARFVCLTEYDAKFDAPVAFGPQDLQHTLGEVIADAGLTQLRIAETEKYAHVTFFFSGGVEDVLPGEERILVPSPKVATYDLQPEMSSVELSAKLVEAIASDRFDVVICNVANPDMVGHSGILGAAIKAAEATDKVIGAVEKIVREKHGALLITADHGNLEMMRDPVTHQPHTAHTVGPVPFVYVGEQHADAKLRGGGALRDVAPTMLDLLGLPKPAEMDGASLFV